jgi:hypothetical protein
MMRRPAVSVLMPVRNAAPYMREAMDSILAQSFADFELVIVDDGSSDDSRSIIGSYADKRIRLIDNPATGLTAALNHGLRECRGALIARMDADDIAYSDRLSTQVAFLAAHADIDILCSDADLINERGGRCGRYRMGPLDRPTLAAAFSYQIGYKPIIHPSVMMRSFVALELGGYRNFSCAEDFDFWIRANARFRFAAIRRPLLAYRQHAGGVSQRRRLQQATSAIMCATTHRVLQSTGIDIFEREPALFERMAERAQAGVEAHVLPNEARFRAARRVTAGRSRALQTAALALAVLRHGTTILPWSRRARSAELVQRLAGDIEAELRLEPAQPAAGFSAVVA